VKVACLSEFQCCVYADGELPAHEAHQVADHLDTCETCRQIVATLRNESRVLVECLQATDFIDFELEDETLAAPQARSLSLVRFAAFVLAMSALLRPVLDLFDELGFQGILNWLPVAAPSIVPAVISLVDSVWSHAGWIALSAIFVLGLFLFSRRSLVTSSILSMLTLLTVFSSSSYGLDIRGGEKPVTVPSGETVDDTLVVAGNSVTIDGTVTGDLVAFTREVIIRGTVKGSVISFARRVEIEGTVEGSVVGFAESVRARGEVAHNIYAFAKNVNVDAGAQVGENLTMFASESDIDGAIGKDAYAWVGSIGVSDRASIGRNLFARVGRRGSAQVASGATVGGFTDIRNPQPAPSRYVRLSFYVWQIIWLTGSFLSGLALFWMFPALSRASFANTQELLVSAGVGFLTFVALPIAAVLAAITLVGLPLGMIALAGWGVAVYAAKIVVAAFLGQSLLGAGSNPASPTALVLLAGLVPIFIATNLPYIGGVINFLLVLVGLGAIAIGAYRELRWRTAPAA
jgi:anti-sigma factor RsiW